MRRGGVIGFTAAAVAALALAGAAGAARPTKGATYRGSNGCAVSCETLKIKVAPGGKRFDFTVNWETICESTGYGSNVWEGSSRGRHTHVRSKGRFHASGSYKHAPPATYGGPADSGDYHVSLTGRFKTAKKAVATLKVTVIGRDEAGKQVDKCTDTEHFVAKRR